MKRPYGVVVMAGLLACLSVRAEPPLTVIEAPGKLDGAAVGLGRIDLTWTDFAANESGFSIERRSVVEESWTRIGEVASDQNVYSVTGLTAATWYDFRVRARNSAVVSAPSAKVGLPVQGAGDPLDLFLRGSWPAHARGYAYDVCVAGDYAYVAAGFGGLVVVDVSKPSGPVRIGGYDTPGDVVAVFARDSLVYLADQDIGLCIVDVADPRNPMLIGSYGTNAAAKDVWVVGNLAYVAFDDLGLQIIDVSDPTRPIRRGGYDTPGYASGLYVVSNRVYVADYNTGLQVIDVSNPSAPVNLTTSTMFSGTKAVHVMGQYAFTADDMYGMVVYDISDPTLPSELTQIYPADSTAMAYSLQIVGSNLFLANGGRGVSVIDISNPASPQLISELDPADVARGIAVLGSYAFVADEYRGLLVLDISTVARPAQVGALATLGDSRGLTLVGTYAYVADWWNGIHVVDFSDPAEPRRVGGYDTAGDAWSVAVTSGRLYVADGASGLAILDVRNPATPTALGSIVTPGGAWRVFATESTAYVADGLVGLTIVSVTNPAAPRVLGVFDTPGDARDVFVRGSYAYVADSERGLVVVDVSNPVVPVRVGGFDTFGSARGVVVTGNYAYVADGTNGLVVLNVTDPANPTLVGQLDTPDQAVGLALWGSYALVSDTMAGLVVIDVSNPAVPRRAGGYNTVGECYDVRVSGGLALVADGHNGMHVFELVKDYPVAWASSETLHDRVRVRWLAVTNAASYRLLRATVGAVQAPVLVSSGLASNVYDDISAVTGRVYTYTVEAVTNAAVTQASLPAIGRLLDVAHLAVDGGAGSGSIDAGGDEDWFRFQVATSGVYILEDALQTLPDDYMLLYGPDSRTNVLAEQDDGGAGKAGRLVKSLGPGEYFLKVRGLSGNVAGSFAARVSTPDVRAPAALAAVLVAPTDVALSWPDSSDNETGFRVERRGDTNVDWAVVAVLRSGSTNYLDRALARNMLYGYRVSAYTEFKSSASPEAAVVTLNPPDMPGAVSRVRVSATRSDVSWVDGSGNETGFAIERKQGLYGPWVRLTTRVANATNWSDTAVLAGSTPYYRVAAFNADGLSPWRYESGMNNPPDACLASTEIRLESMGDVAILDASCSMDADNNGPLFYSWRESPRNPVFGLIPLVSDSHARLPVQFPSPGLYEFFVRVSDGLDMSESAPVVRVYVPGVAGRVALASSEAHVRVSDARIFAYAGLTDANTNAQPLDAAISDSLGEFVLENARPGAALTNDTFYVRLERNGFETQIKPATLTARPDVTETDGSKATEQDFAMSRGMRPNELRGFVWTPQETPVTNGVVSLVGVAGNFVATLSTNGEFRFENVPYGSCSVQIRAAGYRSEVRDVYIGQKLGTLHFHLEGGAAAGSALRVVVYKAGTVQPVQGVNAELGGGLSGVTAVDGTVQFDGLRVGAYALNLAASGYHPVRLPYLDLRAGTNVVTVGLARSRPGVLAGTVTDKLTGRPVRLATVGVETTAGLMLQSDVTDYTGYYQINDIPAGSRVVRVSAGGYKTFLFDLGGSDDSIQNIGLVRMSNWRVPQAPPTNAPVAAVAQSTIYLANLGQSVWLNAGPSRGVNLEYIWRESPDNPVFGLLPAGSGTMSNIQVSGISRPGVYRFELGVRSGGLLSANTESITVLAPGLSGNVHASPSDGVLGLGQVTVRAYTNLAEAAAWAPTYADSKTTLSDPAGDFALDGLSTGAYWIVARAAQGAGYETYGPVLRRVNYSSSARRTAINLAGREVDFSGTVVDSSNRPLENVRVVLSMGAVSETFRTTTDAKGMFRFTGVASGSGRYVMFIKEGYRTVVQAMSIFEDMLPWYGRLSDMRGLGRTEPELTREPARQILEADGQTVTAMGYVAVDYRGFKLPVSGAEVVLGGGFARAFTDANGFYSFTGIPRGTYFGTIRKAGYRSTGLVDAQFVAWTNVVNTNAMRVMRFKDRPPVVRGVIVDEYQQPITGVTVTVATPVGLFGRQAKSDRATLARTAPGLMDGESAPAVTNDANGVFMLAGIPEGEQVLQISMPGGRTVTKTLVLSEQTEAAVTTDAAESDVPYSWSAQYFPEGTAFSAAADTDGDGMSNYEEYLADTDPTTNASVFEVSDAMFSGGAPIFMVQPSSTGRVYDVYFTTNLLATNWVLFAGNVYGTGGSLNIGVTNKVGREFYRVKVHLP